MESLLDLNFAYRMAAKVPANLKCADNIHKFNMITIPFLLVNHINLLPVVSSFQLLVVLVLVILPGRYGT